MQHSLNLKKPLAFFDLETTGVSVVKDRIVEISIAKAMMDGTAAASGCLQSEFSKNVQAKVESIFKPA